MNDLRRWDGGDPSDLESQLLTAARGDRIPLALRERMASGLSASLTSTALVGAGAASSGLLFSKAGLWGALALLAVAAPAFHALHSDEPAVQPGPIAQAEPAAPSTAVAPAPAPAAAPSEPTEPEPAPAAANDVSALRAEVALLDRARRALRSGDGQDALALLARHERTFASGALVPEAEALRIETLLHQGDRARAEQRYRQFAARYPAHPLSERIGRLLER